MQYLMNITVQGLIGSLVLHVSVFTLIILKEKPCLKKGIYLSCLPAWLLALHEDLCQTYVETGGRGGGKSVFFTKEVILHAYTSTFIY